MVLKVSTIDEFEAACGKLIRLYRAQQELFSTTPANDKTAVGRWVRLGGKILEQQNELISAIEEWSGTADLRIVVEDLKKIRDERARVPAGERA